MAKITNSKERMSFYDLEKEHAENIRTVNEFIQRWNSEFNTPEWEKHEKQNEELKNTSKENEK